MLYTATGEKLSGGDIEFWVLKQERNIAGVKNSVLYRNRREIAAVVIYRLVY